MMLSIQESKLAIAVANCLLLKGSPSIEEYSDNHTDPAFNPSVILEELERAEIPAMVGNPNIIVPPFSLFNIVNYPLIDVLLTLELNNAYLKKYSDAAKYATWWWLYNYLGTFRGLKEIWHSTFSFVKQENPAALLNSLKEADVTAEDCSYTAFHKYIKHEDKRLGSIHSRYDLFVRLFNGVPLNYPENNLGLEEIFSDNYQLECSTAPIIENLVKFIKFSAPNSRNFSASTFTKKQILERASKEVIVRF